MFWMDSTTSPMTLATGRIFGRQCIKRAFRFVLAILALSLSLEPFPNAAPVATDAAVRPLTCSSFPVGRERVERQRSDTSALP